MKINAYLLNTYDNLLDWHKTSVSSLGTYCQKHGINLKVMTKNDPLVRVMLGHNIAHHYFLRKLLRIYDFVNSDADVGIFLDMDTLVLRLEQDIRQLIKPNTNYMHHEFFGLDEFCHKERPWLKMKADISAGFLGDRYRTKVLNTDTGFAVYTKDFSIQLIEYLEQKDLDIRTRSGLLNALKINKYADVEGQRVSDESYVQFFLQENDKYKDFAIDLPCESELCSSSYDIDIESRDKGFKGMKTWSMQNVCKHNCVFHHMLGIVCADRLIPFYIEAFKK